MLGDGHAGFGDGELLVRHRKSMDVQFSVNLLKRHRISWPRVGTCGHLETLGAPGALERGFREAISEMLRWLMQDYGLSSRKPTIL